ncbi:hypothetical protein H112_04791 [Trichophyton rubrum D6]|uniref:Major facilitator superfamily (MFS) profile domain-containing protein n=3 Tax=Trichophyton TaxID=5550 RepID=F2SNP5_TRIRC|nr:uncharacterized protein TERG_04555 [Trichophyton rubrum CBS 118892]EZF22340.1 hypothetical protein H100_04800 [Trichophyton rubrum MR850]EZF41488.1 hypothetical protein H102_04787 [Trichophyton rubrum CBS 100081]EZF52062.1 hypothetical protein H103_04791 [Trichophyton rubrum CBS 288.86]EZF62719.1 hypothetical protein H104_04778 [Trichophyton rubrum CBS 289.86]EZF83966.1 hypothetical protein H110_04787 [Trichophyton rubrum MR1448]EZF94603.1 hypothetical protein H113_04828 [Trichophyton rubr
MALPQGENKPAGATGVIEDVELSGAQGSVSDEKWPCSSQEHRPEVEKKLVRRQDWIIMPQFAVLYLLAYLDRINLGNAKLQGVVEEALNGNDSNFSWAASIFYFGYIIFAIPLTLWGKRFYPSRFIFVSVIGWGIAATAGAGAFNFAGLATSRFFIGLFEAAFAPTAVFHLTLWYTRSELAFRTCLFVGMSAFSGAFGGLVAYGISLIHTTIGHWRVLFLVEGLPTIAFAFVVLFFLPDRPETSKFFRNEEERQIAIRRMNQGQQSEGHNSLVMKHVIASLKDWKVYGVCIVKMGHDASLATISIFLPTILHSLGYSKTAAQYMTIGPYMAGWVVMVSFSLLSDRLRTRGPFIIGGTALAIIGVSLMYTFPAKENPKAALGGVFLLVIGIFPCIPLEVQWVSDNAGAESKKAMALCMIVIAGHCLSILASKSFPEHEGPRYIRGYAIVLSFLCLSFVTSVILYTRHRIINAQRNKKYGKPNPLDKVDTSILADKAPMFRYIP